MLVKPARAGRPVTLVQRFGSALNLNVHFHMLFLDGVYVERHDGSLRFQLSRTAKRFSGPCGEPEQEPHCTGRQLQRCIAKRRKEESGGRTNREGHGPIIATCLLRRSKRRSGYGVGIRNHLALRQVIEQQIRFLLDYAIAFATESLKFRPVEHLDQSA